MPGEAADRPALLEAKDGSRRAAEARGRDFSQLRIVPLGVLPDAAKLDYYAELGVHEAVLRVPSDTRDKVLPVLDAYARFL